MNARDIPCAVTQDLNRYLSRLDAEDDRDARIEERTEELLAGEYAPFHVGNLGEALGEIDIDTLAALLAAGKIEEAGNELAMRVRSYWQRIAEDKAETDIDDELANQCPRCRGRGCRYCDEDYGRDE